MAWSWLEFTVGPKHAVVKGQVTSLDAVPRWRFGLVLRLTHFLAGASGWYD